MQNVDILKLRKKKIKRSCLHAFLEVSWRIFLNKGKKEKLIFVNLIWEILVAKMLKVPALSGGLCKLYRKSISRSGRKSSLKVPTDWYHQCYVGAPHRWRLFCFNHLILNTDKSVGGQSGWPLTISHRGLNGDIMVQRCILSLFPFGSPPMGSLGYLFTADILLLLEVR